MKMHYKGRFRGVTWGAEAPPPKFYYEQARKLLYRSKYNCIYTHVWAMKDGKNNLTPELL